MSTWMSITLEGHTWDLAAASWHGPSQRLGVRCQLASNATICITAKASLPLELARAKKTRYVGKGVALSLAIEHGCLNTPAFRDQLAERLRRGEQQQVSKAKRARRVVGSKMALDGALDGATCWRKVPVLKLHTRGLVSTVYGLHPPKFTCGDCEILKDFGANHDTVSAWL